MALGIVFPLGGILLLALIVGVAFSFLKRDDGENGCALGLFLGCGVLLVPLLLFMVPLLLGR